ncbi:uncharacterized protein (TIGR02598 family) [Roseimicrobium gellanilyticum]|uniref:Uncharacterized protein (TIGR02598 family) n=1 Tax=Roseimicrobium gellanilyticum TaxID=748857 RepID=A0A366HI16_9BACT|nr:Verru_Chthon cassette protein B [Roseimicrobium gellanilyticum]RBP41249.1 uncharacterized protein (TIGR02598 family) [Roseimicrobium gellanilyticum]
MKLKRSPFIVQPGQQGFSLIEVSLAVAIAAVGFITLLGLLPQGLDMARRSANLASEARIVQKLSGELQSASWEELQWKGYGKKRYFNDQAMEISEAELSNPAVSFSLSYVACVYLPDQGLDLMLPAGRGAKTAAATSAQNNARRLGIAIVPTTNAGYHFGGGMAQRHVIHPVIIARMNAEAR